MDHYTLELLVKQLKIAALFIVRENIEVAILDALAQSNIIKNLIFYGGTALRLAYRSPRFSEDLDFLMIKKIMLDELKSILETFAQNNSGAELKDYKEKRNTLFALLNYKTPLLKHPLNIKIEISKLQNGVDCQFIPLSSPCSHQTPIVPTATIESLEQLKKNAIKDRQVPRDWFDLWYITTYLKKPYAHPKPFPFTKEIFKNELKRLLPKNNWMLIDQIP